MYPAFADLMGGPDGTIWVHKVRTAASLRENEGTLDPAAVGSYWAGFSLGPPRPDWDVFDAEGRFLGTMGLPDRFNPLRVHDGAIYGVQRDELDVQYVVRLRIIGI